MIDQLEKIAKIISLIGIPLVIWWLGTQYQSADGRTKTAVEYVKLSIQIITNDNEADPELYDWATKTLNYYSNVKLSKRLKNAVSSGEVNLSPTKDNGEWHTVIGSWETKQGALNFINSLETKKYTILNNLKFDIYKSEKSNIYAVTIGGKTSKSVALNRANMARKQNLATDAFAKKNAEWILVKNI